MDALPAAGEKKFKPSDGTMHHLIESKLLLSLPGFLNGHSSSPRFSVHLPKILEIQIFLLSSVLLQLGFLLFVSQKSRKTRREIKFSG